MASISSPSLGLLVCCMQQAAVAAMHIPQNFSTSLGGSLWPAPPQHFQQPIGLLSTISTVVGGLVAKQDLSLSTPAPPSIHTVAGGMLIAALSTIAAGIAFRPDKSQTSASGSEEVYGAMPVRQLSAVQIWAVTALQFAYGFAVALQGLVLSALDAKRLWPKSSSVALGTLVVICGVAQIVGPLAGHYSDRWRSRFGRRRPLILISTCGLACLTFALWLCSSLQFPTCYLVVFLVQQITWNVLCAAQSGLVPDLVVPEQRGFAGGASAANVLAGALVAMLGVIAFSAWDYHVHYSLMIVVLLATSSVVCLAAKEESSINRRIDRHDQGGWWTKVKDLYTLDIGKYPDFALLLVTKTVYGSVVVVKGFLLFFAEDTFRLPDKSGAQSLTARVAVMAELSAAVVAIATMMVLDGSKGGSDDETQDRRSPEGRRWGTTTRSIMALGFGQLLMGVLWFGPIWVGWKVDTHFPEGGNPAADAWGSWMVRATAFWGAAQGLYLAGDQALSFALVPEQDQAARYLSLNSVCGCIGASVGGVACGALLTHFGSEPKQGQAYAFGGYAAVFVFASIMGIAASAIALHMRLREQRSEELAAERKK